MSNSSKKDRLLLAALTAIKDNTDMFADGEFVSVHHDVLLAKLAMINEIASKYLELLKEAVSDE